MKLDKFTFGKSPAAMYLGLILNERDDRYLARKVTSFLTERRMILNEVVASHHLSDSMSAKTFGVLLSLFSKSVKADVTNFKDKIIQNLLVNILKAEINFHLARVRKAALLNKRLAKGAEEGVTVPTVKATPFPKEESLEDKNKRLAARSAAHLARNGRINTLY